MGNVEEEFKSKVARHDTLIDGRWDFVSEIPGGLTAARSGRIAVQLFTPTGLVKPALALAAAMLDRIPDVPFTGDSADPFTPPRVPDPCALLTRKEAEAVLGPLPVAPYAASKGTALVYGGGASCAYYSGKHRSLVITTMPRHGAEFFKMMGGVDAQVAAKTGGSQGPNTLEGNWDAKVIPLRAPITLRGKTVAKNAAKPVTIAIALTKSDVSGVVPPPARLTAPYLPDGSFSLNHTPTQEGHYRAVATSPDGSGRDGIEFDVSSMRSASAAVDELAASLDLVSDLVDADEQIIESQQPSPARTDALKNFPALKSALAKRKEAIDDYRRALKTYDDMAAHDPVISGAFGPAYRHLADFKRESGQLTPNLQQILDESRKQNTGCDNLIIVQEGFKYMQTLFSLMNMFTLGANTFVKDGAGPLKAPMYARGGPFSAVTLGFGVAKAKAIAGNLLVNQIPGQTAHLAGFLTGQLFDVYCEKFEGPILGDEIVEYLHEGEMWWRYTVRIEGRMTLAYSKAGAGKGVVALKGHIVGTGTNFTVTDHALAVLKRELLSKGFIIGHTTAPVGFPFTSAPGVVALQAVPTAFFIPIDGSYDIASKKMKVNLGPSRTDLSESFTVAVGRYAVGGGYNMANTSFVTYEIGFDNANKLIAKATDADLGPLEIPVVTGEKSITAERTFRTSRDRPHAQGNYTVKVKLCNPSC